VSTAVAEVTAAIDEAIVRAKAKSMSEIITPELRARILEGIRTDILGGSGFMPGFRIVCDETNNTDADREAGILNLSVLPPPAAISIRFTVTKDGLISHPADAMAEHLRDELDAQLDPRRQECDCAARTRCAVTAARPGSHHATACPMHLPRRAPDTLSTPNS